jgi:hypothetical protein
MPTLADFITFLQVVVGLTTAQTNYNANVIQMAYDVAVGLTNQYLTCMPLGTPPPSNIQSMTNFYVVALYNLGADRVINFGSDAPGAPPVDGSSPPTPFFAWMRKQWNLNSFVSGVISGAHDESTGDTLMVPTQLQGLMIGDLQLLGTPYGRQYLSYTGMIGPNSWGIS